MESDRLSTTLDHTSRTHRRTALSRLRQAYFAQGRESVQRYGIRFDDVLVHLWRARHTERAFSLRAVRYVDDLVHAVACTHNLGVAWRDLSEYYERPLIRHCRHWLEEPAATLFVRRLLTEMRRPAGGGPRPALPSLSHYGGTWPLRRWLGNRVVGCLAGKTLIVAHRPPSSHLRPQVADNLRRQLDKDPQGFTLAR
ncbi:MAG: hypothetical protein JSV91_08060 [Phycisphaerales bacterium]|nr:MAG: hypothetical protein JSV91_08060 [Phycisphaerales bacterium]